MDRIDEVVKVLNANLLYVGNITDYNAYGIAEKVKKGEQILLYEKTALGVQNGISIDDSKKVTVFHTLSNIQSQSDNESGSGGNPRLIETYNLSLYTYYSNPTNTVTSKELLEIAKMAFPTTLSKNNKKALQLSKITFEVTDSSFDKHSIFENVFTRQKNNLSDDSILVQIDYQVTMEFNRNCIPYLPCDLSQYDIELQRGINNCTDVKDCIGIIESGSAVKYLNEQGNFVTVTSINDINGLIKSGTNVTITGSGTQSDPYIISSSGGGSGGAVDSVNGQTGVVVLDTGDIGEVTDKNYVTDAELLIIQTPASTSDNGYLTSTDWDTFNSKQDDITFGTGVLAALGNDLGASGGVLGNTSANTLLGSLGFSGTTNSGLRLNNLTSAQIAALTPAIGMLEANTTTNVPVYYDGTRWVALKGNTVYNVRDWGAIGDGSTNDKAAIDACIAAAPAGSVIYFPKGNYFLSAALATITKTLNIKGDGRTTFITCNSTTGTVFNFDGGSTAGDISYINIEDLYISNLSSTTPTSGNAIRLRYCAFPTINRVIVSNFFNNIAMIESYAAGLNHYICLGAINSGLLISNTDPLRVDWGDHNVTNCMFISSSVANTEYGIVHNNSGGLRITSSKFLRAGPSFAFNYPYYYVGLATTVKLMITGNSFDTFNKSAIYVSKGTGLFSNVTITGNTIETGNVGFPTIYLDGLFAVAVTGNSLTGQVTNAAIEINNCNDVHLNNSYRNYNTPILLTGTNTNINGSINSNFRLPNNSISGGQASYLQSAIGANLQQQFGVGFNAFYSGTANASSGRNAVVTDAITSIARWGIDQNGTMWVGESSLNYGAFITNAGSMVLRPITAGVGLRNHNITALASNSGGVYTASAPFATLANQRLGVFAAGGFDGTNAAQTGRIQVFSSETHTFGSATGGYMTFETTTNGTTGAVERMRLTQDGSFGIGTTTPLSRLDINGSKGELIVVSSASTLTLADACVYNFSGTTATWTLPAISATTNRVYKIKNRGSGSITLNRSGSDNIYNTSSVTSITITAGQACELRNDGSFWVVYNLN